MDSEARERSLADRDSADLAKRGGSGHSGVERLSRASPRMAGWGPPKITPRSLCSLAGVSGCEQNPVIADADGQAVVYGTVEIEGAGAAVGAIIDGVAYRGAACGDEYVVRRSMRRRIQRARTGFT